MRTTDAIMGPCECISEVVGIRAAFTTVNHRPHRSPSASGSTPTPLLLLSPSSSSHASSLYPPILHSRCPPSTSCLVPPRRRPPLLNIAANRPAMTMTTKCPTSSQDPLPVPSALSLRGLPRPTTSVSQSHLNTEHAFSFSQTTTPSHTRVPAIPRSQDASSTRPTEHPRPQMCCHPGTHRHSALLAWYPLFLRFNLQVGDE